MEVGVLERVAGMPPGAVLAAVLGGLDLGEVPNDRVVDVLQAQHRQLAHDQARMLGAMVEVARSTPLSGLSGPEPTGVRRAAVSYAWAPGEVAAALTFTARAAERELHVAETLIDVLPWVYAALLAGRIDRAKAWVFAEHLDPGICELTEAQLQAICVPLLGLAPGLTVGQVAARLLKAILAIDPTHARRRYHRAVADRAVVGYLRHDGTVTITATGLPPDEAAAACARLDALAGAVKRAGHPAGLAQIQADLFLGLLDGRYHHLTRTQIIADLLTRPRRDDTPTPTATAAATTTTTDTAATTEEKVEAATEDAGRGAAEPSDTARPDPTVRPDPAAGPIGHGEPDVAARESTEPGTSTPSGAPPGADSPVGVRAGIEIRVGLTTLIGLDEDPGEIPGLGPVLAEVARTATWAQRRGAQWRFAVTDPDGYLILAGLTRRRPHTGSGNSPTVCHGGIVEIHVPATTLARLAADPAGCGPWVGIVADIATQYAHRDTLTTALDLRPADRFARGALARHIQIRDRTCCHPGCPRPARTTDLDHTRDRHRGGPTLPHNIGPVCARHHLYKTELGWRLHQPQPGHFIWTSPLGRVYHTRGEPISPPEPRPPPA